MHKKTSHKISYSLYTLCNVQCVQTKPGRPCWCNYFFLQIQGTLKTCIQSISVITLFGHHICPDFGMWSEKAEETIYTTIKSIRTPSKFFQQHTRVGWQVSILIIRHHPLAKPSLFFYIFVHLFFLDIIYLKFLPYIGYYSCFLPDVRG